MPKALESFWAMPKAMESSWAMAKAYGVFLGHAVNNPFFFVSQKKKVYTF